MESAHELINDQVIVIGDFNAKVGCSKANEYPILGKHGFGERNARGDRLINYAFEYKLSIMNTFFKKKQNRRWTWISPDQKQRMKSIT